jgi:hypothetical protein
MSRDRSSGSGTLVVPRGTFSIEEPWIIPTGSSPVRLRRSTDGEVPRLTTTLSVYHDEECLNLVFSAADDHVVATMFAHDEPLYEEDVVEVFLAPERPDEYYEIEANPVATIFDARIVSPNGERSTMRADPAWDCDGLLAAVRRNVEAGGAISIDTLLRIPFRALGRDRPGDGETWRANFFRIDRHPAHGDEFSAWRPTFKDPADFHVTSAFGSLTFGG